MSSRTVIALTNLVVLSKLIDCSSSALILNCRIGWFDSLSVQIVLSITAESKVIGRDMSSWALPWSSRRTSSATRPGMCCCKQEINFSPTPLFLLQSSNSWSSDPISVQPGILQTEDLIVFILWSFAWVGRRLCIKRQRKLAKTGGIPGCLHAAQAKDQSVSGLASSALQGRNCWCPVLALLVMVTYSSVRSLTQSLSVILMMLRGVSSFVLLITEKNSWLKYGGGGSGAPGTSSPRMCFL